MTEAVITENEEKKDKKPEPGTGHTKQAFLVGEQVYVRPIEEDDAEYASSWMQGIVRRSETAAKSWIEDDLKSEKTQYLLIIRKSNDRPVGSIEIQNWAHNNWLSGYIDPLYGDQGQHWLAEAYTLVLQWKVDEQHGMIAHVEEVPSTMPIVLEKLQAMGARIASTFREAHKEKGEYVEWNMVSYLNKDWVKTLGDPFETEKPRSGTGEARPVIAPVTVEGDLHPGAVRIGPRVYLRPMKKSDAAEVEKWARKETEPFWSSGRGVYTQTSLEKFIENLGKSEPQEWARFAVCLRENDEFIGAVGIDGIDYTHRRAESESEFYNINYRGGGYGTEAKHLLFDYAFNTLGLHSLQSWVMYTNTRSAAALRKQGYHDVGIEPWLVLGEGGFDNFGTYELLADEWRAMPRANVEEN